MSSLFLQHAAFRLRGRPRLKVAGLRRLPAFGRLLASAVLALLCTARALGQGGELDNAATDCASITDNAARLACYDRAFEAGDVSSNDDARRDADAPPEEDARRNANAPSDDARRDANAPPEETAPEPDADEATAVTVVEVYERITGAVFVTEAGNIWIQTDGRRFFAPETPFEAEIRPGALGSFFLVPNNGRAIRVRQQ